MEDIVIDVEVWAKQVRKIKIREMEELIAHKQEIVNSVANTNNLLILLRREELVNDIIRLKSKLEILYA